MKNIFLAPMTDRENRGRGKGTRTGATKTAFSPLTVVLLIVLILYALTLIGLLFWAVITSFKSQAEFRINILGFPDKWVWNYGEVFRSFQVPVMAEDGTRYVSMGGMILNSVIYSFGCAIASTITPCITAYLCAKFPFRFSKVVYFIVIVTMALPIVGSLPSEMLVARTFGVYDRIWLLWIMKANFLGIFFLVFHAEFKGIPKEYTEAAKIDGAGNFTILFRIMLPLVRNTIFVIMLIKFIEFWNDYQTPLVFLPSYPTLAYGVFTLATTSINKMSTVPMRMASAVMMLIPILVVFLIFQKKIMSNVSVGGIKG